MPRLQVFGVQNPYQILFGDYSSPSADYLCNQIRNPISEVKRHCDPAHEAPIHIVNQRRTVENWASIPGIDGWESVVVLVVLGFFQIFEFEAVEIPLDSFINTMNSFRNLLFYMNLQILLSKCITY